MAQLATLVKNALGYGSCELGVALVTAPTIARLNARYRGRRGVTDILSFAAAACEPGRPEMFLEAPAVDGKLQPRDLGDLYICPDYIARHCRVAHRRSDITRSAGVADSELDAQWRTVLVHGVVHLLGYDHEADADWAAMSAREAVAAAALATLEEGERVQLFAASGY